MASIKAVTTLPYTTNVPEDIATNVSYWITPEPLLPAHLNEIGARLIAAYQGFDGYIGGLVSRSPNVCTVTLYNLGDPAPRLPIESYPFTLDNPTTGSTALPPEVAVVMSYRAAYVSGIPNARRRGRMFLGPINDAGTALTRPTVALTNAVVDFGETLFTPVTEEDVVWAQRSETTGAMSPVETGWVDNEWDTQRRRGRTANQRYPFFAPPG